MEIRTTSLLFPKAEDEGPLSAQAEIVFPRDVERVTAGITGYTAVFEDEDDHHFGRLEVEVNARVDADDATKVIVSGAFGLRDWSNEFDDPYSGLIDIAVLADLVPVTTPDPGDARGDLVIVGAEVTQAIQHFRSGDHLDSPNVFPDNSIRLIAGKPTVVRLYVDYDVNSGLAPIPLLSGTLTLFNPAGSTVLSPIESIAPRRDVSIDRGSRRHTLNFLIPDAQSLGEVNLFATVFDAGDTAQMSVPFERTIQFVQQPPLRVIAVGIEYTGDDVKDDADPADLLAPDEADFVDTLEFTDRIFPIPSVTITDYRTMEYDKDVESDINEGCDKLGDLKDAVGDFVGDSDDIVYGLYGSGLNTGSVGGCGGGGVGVGFVGAGGTAAHEIAHALGRKHAPCDNVTRCATPRNTDDSYPSYSGYDSDSIGEYGFDPTSMFGTVRNPSTFHDVMGYSPNRWISPYNYKALMSAVPGSSVSGSAAKLARAATRRSVDSEWLPVKQPKLFLRLNIGRDGVDLHPSFCFDALPRPAGGRPTAYTIELVDQYGKTLRRDCLQAEDPSCGSGETEALPIRVRQAIAFDKHATALVLYRGDEKVESWDIPAPPDVEVECRPDEDPKYLNLTWKVTGPGSKTKHKNYWSLVQWRDRAGTWRGVAARMTGNQLRVPRWIAAMGSDIQYRVLVTTGISTGIGYWEGDCDDVVEYRPDAPTVVISGFARPRTGSQELPRVVTATVVGAGEYGGRIRWFGAAGGELARGGRLDLGQLSVGSNVVSATLVGSEYNTPVTQWLIERTKDDRFVIHTGDIGADRPSDDEPHEDHDHDHDGRHHHHPHAHEEGK